MKTVVKEIPRYPGCADRNRQIQKLVDAVLSVATVLGLVTIFCWLIIVF